MIASESISLLIFMLSSLVVSRKLFTLVDVTERLEHDTSSLSTKDNGLAYEIIGQLSTVKHLTFFHTVQSVHYNFVNLVIITIVLGWKRSNVMIICIQKQENNFKNLIIFYLLLFNESYAMDRRA